MRRDGDGVDYKEMEWIEVGGDFMYYFKKRKDGGDGQRCSYDCRICGEKMMVFILFKIL